MAKRYRRTSGFIFAVVAIGHAIRALRAIPVQVGDSPFPVWLSWVFVVVAGSLSIWAFLGRD